MRVTPVILAGGAGERLWPLSRAESPKQFSITEEAFGNSLFQAAVERVASASHYAPPLILCHEDHRYLVSEQLRQLGYDGAAIITEPVRCNTAASLCLAALHVSQRDPQAVMLVLPSDHRIGDAEALHAAVVTAIPVAEEGSIVLFSVVPTAPETSYGYIVHGESLAAHPELHHVTSFVEKPDAVRAAALIAAGQVGWNSGMFLLRADVALQEFRRHALEILDACSQAYALVERDYAYLRPSAKALGGCPVMSFDVAVMESTERAVAIALDAQWSDLGSWNALAQLALHDPQGNSGINDRLVLEGVAGSHFYSDGPVIAALGMTDVIVAATADAVLVADKRSLGQMRELTSKLNAMHSDPTKMRVVHRPWGRYVRLDGGNGYQVKRLHIRPGAKISLQKHAHRNEHWVVVCGVATVTRGEIVFTLEKHDSTHIVAGQEHRIENCGTGELVLIEVQTGSYIGEDDITRLEDAYQRV